MEMIDILELERKNNQQKIDQAIREAKHKNQQSMINLGVSIISEQMRQNTMAMFRGIL
jgi:hypothetical protein